MPTPNQVMKEDPGPMLKPIKLKVAEGLHCMTDFASAWNGSVPSLVMVYDGVDAQMPLDPISQ